MDWGMKNRMARIIRPDTGRAVMLALDHGYFLVHAPPRGSQRNHNPSSSLRRYHNAHQRSAQELGRPRLGGQRGAEGLGGNEHSGPAS